MNSGPYILNYVTKRNFPRTIIQYFGWNSEERLSPHYSLKREVQCIASWSPSKWAVEIVLTMTSALLTNHVLVTATHQFNDFLLGLGCRSAVRFVHFPQGHWPAAWASAIHFSLVISCKCSVSTGAGVFGEAGPLLPSSLGALLKACWQLRRFELDGA